MTHVPSYFLAFHLPNPPAYPHPPPPNCKNLLRCVLPSDPPPPSLFIRYPRQAAPSASARGKSNHQQSIEALKDELEREIQRNVQLRAKNGNLSRDLSSKELKISRLRNDLVAASAIIDATKIKLVQAEGKCKEAERELDTVQKDIITDHASLDLERRQMAGKLEESEKELEELRSQLAMRNRKFDVLTTEMDKLREGEEDKELKILSLEDLCGVKEREVARYSDMLQEMQQRLHADHTAVSVLYRTAG